jgi:hypothetical protein
MEVDGTAGKLFVLVLAALVGLGLGMDGLRAPRLHTALPGLSRGAGSGVVAHDRNPAGDAGHPAQPPRARPAPGATAAPQGTGPLLSQTRYARYAYQVYPETGSARTVRALTGFRLAFRPVTPETVQVAVTVLQDNTTQTAAFDRHDRLYFIEARWGDDGFDGETNFGDDGFVLTDAQGHIISR